MFFTRAGIAWLVAAGLAILSLGFSGASRAASLVLDSGVPAYSPYVEHVESILAMGSPERDIIVTFGDAAFSDAISNHPDSPILALLILSSSFQKIYNAHGAASDRHVSAIFADPSPVYQLLLADLIAPSRRSLLALTQVSASSYTPAPQYGDGLDVRIFPEGDTKGLLDQMDQFDLLIARPDSSLYNQTSLQPIVRSLYRRKKFLIGYSKGMTDAGAIASVAPDKDGLLDEVEDLLNEYLKNGSLPPPRYPRSFTISFNDILARSLGLPPLKAEILQREIESQVGEKND